IWHGRTAARGIARWRGATECGVVSVGAGGETIYECGCGAVSGSSSNSRLRSGDTESGADSGILERGGRSCRCNGSVSSGGEEDSVFWQRRQRGGCAAPGGGAERTISERTQKPVGMGADDEYLRADGDWERLFV